MRVHTRSVVLEEWLWHECGHVSILVADITHDVLIKQYLVCHAGHGVVPHVDLGLARSPHLMMMDLDLYSCCFESQDDFRAQILHLVCRRNREIAFLEARPVGKIRHAAIAPAVPDALVRIDVVVAEIGALLKAERIEDVELDLGAPVAELGHTRVDEILLSLASDEARVPGISSPRNGIGYITDQAEGWNLEDRVDDRGRRVCEEEHVAFVNLLESTNARSI